ncbi:MAG: FHA domain-containing protein [Gammaproteobacteria bacterium]|nr:FHA domain-containing protein [Gammaproteobacteria bacterium]MCP4929919.1 FHA domain-containing protein [Gammaproteobacteria bacterium]
MSFLGIELNDAGITCVTDAGVVFSEPGCALLNDQGMVFGAAAQQAASRFPRAFHDRYWLRLSDEPLTAGLGGVQTCADLVHAQLAQIWEVTANDVSQVAFSVPSYWSRDQLALLLGISQELDIPLKGLVENPVAATRRPYPGYELLNIETGMHLTGISHMHSEASEIKYALDTVADTGVVALRRTCAEYISGRFLECCRFDPLHDAESEQGVYDLMDEWLATLVQSGTTKIRMNYKGNDYSALLDVASLSSQLRRCSQALIQVLRSVVSVDQPTALQIDAHLASYPGVVDMLLELPGCDVFVLESGAAARGLWARHKNLLNNSSSTEAGCSLSVSLPFDQLPVQAAEKVVPAIMNCSPTHLLHAGVAYRLGALAFHIGTELDTSDYGFLVSSRHAGVSRQHCSIELSEGHVRLNDYSRFGTFLNGRKLKGSAILQTGDLVSVGDPACDFQLITEAGPDGA